MKYKSIKRANTDCPRVPFTPGYAIVGDVDAIGEGVANVSVGKWAGYRKH